MSKEQKTLKSCYILDRLRDWFELYGNQNHQRAEEELHLAIDELYEYQQKDQQIADLEAKLAESERKNFELLTKLNLKEYAPAFCKLAGRDCEWLGKEKQLAIEVLTMFEAILSRAIQWDNNYKCWTISEEVFGNIIMQIDEKIEELKGEE